MTAPLPQKPAAHVERVLCVLAHPDDVDFGSAGTVATWTAAGTEVTYCVVTDGDAGGFDDTPRDQMGPLRRAEQRAAAAAVGVSDVRFLVGIAEKGGDIPGLRIEIAEVNGLAAIVGWVGAEPFGSFSLTMADGRIEQILVVVNPDKLAGLVVP